LAKAERTKTYQQLINTNKSTTNPSFRCLKLISDWVYSNTEPQHVRAITTYCRTLLVSAMPHSCQTLYWNHGFGWLI